MATKTITLVVVIAFMLFATTCSAQKQEQPSGVIEHRVHVYIKNGLADSKNLTVHCKSKEDDLGFQHLAPGGSWTFTFRPRIFNLGKTLYFCRFEWKGIDFHYFNIYSEKRDLNVCNDCCWTIRENGPCQCTCFGPPCDFRKCFPWNRK